MRFTRKAIPLCAIASGEVDAPRKIFKSILIRINRLPLLPETG